MCEAGGWLWFQSTKIVINWTGEKCGSPILSLDGKANDYFTTYPLINSYKVAKLGSWDEDV